MFSGSPASSAAHAKLDRVGRPRARVRCLGIRGGPGFAALLSGSRLYLALASVGGLVALACGAITVFEATEETLAILVLATIGLWAAATARHTLTRQSNSTAIG